MIIISLKYHIFFSLRSSLKMYPSIFAISIWIARAIASLLDEDFTFINLHVYLYNNILYKCVIKSVCPLEHRVGADAEPPACEARLLNGDLWRRFHDIGTEMIITKGGR